MKSMTGYGNSEITTGIGKILVEARSENHRFLDCKIQTSDTFNSLEPELVSIVKNNISRGKIKITINVEENKEQKIKFDRTAGKKYYTELKSFMSNLGIKEEINLGHILIFRELFNNEAKNKISTKTVRNIKKALNDTLIKLNKSRQIEGNKLKNDLKKRLRKCEAQIKSIKRKRKNYSKQAYKKLKEKILLLLEDTALDESRLFQEVAILTERSDITEELVRIEAHFGKFRTTMNRSDPIGKELDFLIQEMTREAGTISAKSKDAAISHNIIALRSEFEKLREQIQNIE